MTSLRSFRRAVAPAVLATVLVAGYAPLAAAQAAHFGPRFGINFDSNDVLLGGQFTFPLADRIEFYPSLDIYFPDAGSLAGLNFDLKFLLPTVGGPHFYAGAGLNVLLASFEGHSDSDVGANLIFGMESRSGPVRPFGEARVLLHDNTTFQIVGGLNFALGR